MQSETRQRTYTWGFCLRRIRVEVFIHPLVVHAGTFFLLRSWRTHHDAQIVPRPCGGDRLGSPAGGRDRLGCVSGFPHPDAQPPEEGKTSYFELLEAISKGSHDAMVSVCVFHFCKVCFSFANLEQM